MSDTTRDILLVEDDPGDVRLIQEAFDAVGRGQSLTVFTDSESALEYLEDQSGSYPDLVLLDLNLPGKNGDEMLQTLREHSKLQSLPVIILSNSATSEDISKCYNAKANAYLTKPTEYDELVSLIETIEQFWFKQVQLPPDP